MEAMEKPATETVPTVEWKAQTLLRQSRSDSPRRSAVSGTSSNLVSHRQPTLLSTMSTRRVGHLAQSSTSPVAIPRSVHRKRGP